MNTENREIAIQLSGVKKMYKLGQIGGGTLRADLQSWWAKKHGKEDPNTKIGEKRLIGQTFMALNGIDLTVYKGEALGIIGSNGAGKSTLLKLLSQVTAPTEGQIDLYGRVASMLEVGTGFNGEMTGRENIYMNGAILGMTKAEIDAKMEDIIEFSEVRDFIDTPVKRYSSGMYVKLAFSVAAHLDSEIMIMDEVLAVGDMAFQKKCLDKMRDVAKKEGRTVLYVSHNMNTIRQLCDRCVVLDQGKVVYEGDVEEAIEIYLGGSSTGITSVFYDERPKWIFENSHEISSLSAKYDGKESDVIHESERMQIHFEWDNNCDVANLCLRLEIRKLDRTIIGTAILDDVYSGKKGEHAILDVSMGINSLVASNYTTTYTFYFRDQSGSNVNVFCAKGLDFQVDSTNEGLEWDILHWGNIIFSDVTVD